MVLSKCNDCTANGSPGSKNKLLKYSISEHGMLDGPGVYPMTTSRLQNTSLPPGPPPSLLKHKDFFFPTFIRIYENFFPDCHGSFHLRLCRARQNQVRVRVLSPERTIFLGGGKGHVQGLTRDPLLHAVRNTPVVGSSDASSGSVSMLKGFVPTTPSSPFRFLSPPPSCNYSRSLFQKFKKRRWFRDPTFKPSSWRDIAGNNRL